MKVLIQGPFGSLGGQQSAHILGRAPDTEVFKKKVKILRIFAVLCKTTTFRTAHVAKRHLGKRVDVPVPA